MPVTRTRSSRRCAPSRTRSCTARSSTSAWSAVRARRRRHRRRPRRPHRRRLPAEERDPATGSTRRVAPLDGRHRRRPRLHRDDRRGARGRCASGCRATAATATRHGQPQGHAEGRPIPFAQPGSRTRPLLISSGKGGVGKSQRHDQPRRRPRRPRPLRRRRRRRHLRLLDPPHARRRPRAGGHRPDARCRPRRGACAASRSATSCPRARPSIWRGPMLHKALEQFLTDVFWDDPDFLLVDMPPGTGDIAISLSQYLPRGEVFVVTTPQPAAQKVARLSAAMAAKVNLHGPRRHREHVVVHRRRRQALRAVRRRRRRRAGRRARRAAARPAAARARRCAPGGDDGRPIAAVDPDSEAGRAFHDLAERIAVDLRPKKVFSDALRVT